MSTLADHIEKYIKNLLVYSGKNSIQLKRSELAEKFMCVPSQINYVLSTRFGIEQGYLVESRRGGGGYVRIIKLPLSNEKELLNLIDSMPDLVSQQVGEGLVKRLYEEDFINKRESQMLNAIIRRETLRLDLPERDIVRGNILKTVICTISKGEFSC